ncbi:MAG: helix-turn-helix domain-containing protein [Planctomycetes bacterium]|nr:helix-turn-helix domain-containing protein [Planctomycetota bacterium]
MKFEIDDTHMVEKIAKMVIDQIKPLLSKSHNVESNEIMTVEETASYLKVKPSWVYDKVASREIPFHKAGKFPRFRKKHVDIWLLNPYHPTLNNYNLNYSGKGVKKFEW